MQALSLPSSGVLYVYTNNINLMVNVVNLQAAHKELDGRTPRIAAPLLALEALVVVSISYALVGIFA